MTGRLIRIVLALYLTATLATGVPAFAQTAAPQQSASPASATTPQYTSTAYTSLFGVRDYSRAKRSFPNIFAPYTSITVAPPVLTNAPTIYDLIHDGKLEISLQDAISLAMQNNLDIAVSEYTPWIDQTNVLNAEGGGTPLGSVVIGSGTGGSFDPVITENTSISDNSQSVNNPLSSGVGTSGGAITQATHDTQFNLSYTQELHSGTTFNIQLNNDRTSSSPSANFFNPALTSSIGVEVSQPLLNGFGFLPHIRFILESKNTNKIGELQFEEQIINSITQIETQYWILVLNRQSVNVDQQAVAAYQKLYEDDMHLLNIGSMSPSDVVTAQSAIAASNQALLGAQVNEHVQEEILLQLITKDPSDPRLKGLELVPTSVPEDTPQAPDISLDDAEKEASADRPELKVDKLTLQNDEYNVRATKNSLLPTLTLSGEYISLGLSGNAAGAFTPNGTFSPITSEPIVDQNGNPVLSGGLPTFLGTPNGVIGPAIPGGISSAYSQIFHNLSPTYAGSLSLNLPLRNRSAQATNAEQHLVQRQDQVADQRQKSTIFASVNEALTAVKLYASEVDAAVKATHLAQQAYDYTMDKFNLGTADTFLVVQYATLLNAAKLNESNVKANYEIALAQFNQAMGRTLTSNNITIAGNRDRGVDLDANAPMIPGTLDGRLADRDIFNAAAHQ
ncbi:MAG TPA: TolC family protein [Candidatus Acidoferrales bacterium]|nr:TolC family protein [Candidatus Acidoferrales bacterium]